MSNVKSGDKKSAAHAVAPEQWTVFTMPLDELDRRVTRAIALLQQAYALFPGLLSLTDQERKMSNGRLRTGEGAMFLVILSVMEKFPAFFEALADLDEGLDPTVVETPLMRDRIQRAEILARLLGQTDQLAAMSDSVLHLRALVRDPIKEAYGIARAVAKTHVELKSMLAPVINFYSAMARAAAATRQADGEAAAKLAADAGTKG